MHSEVMLGGDFLIIFFEQILRILIYSWISKERGESVQIYVLDSD